MPSEAQKKASAKWDKSHMTVVGVKVTRSVADAFAAACAQLGKTKYEVLRQAVEATIQAADDAKREP